MAHSIRCVQRFGEIINGGYVYMNCDLVNAHELFACAVACIQRLVGHMTRNVFRRRGKWVMLF